ncbi:hypothetical protein TCAL_17391 [Tigriopus californicus]|uniref:glucan 1,3-beta-glucosidase n=1 Tax=Tigriopus californicus TaxID=6832 RepID=A0A553P067_TIGCA|nr:uncharacterized protein LOC131886156 [Tigriopus californicus]TRY71084.1 hypothetical protein TCAL_17391 [Tigriopus californicus]|eukprot:TCALIF_13426-PA protein Name:"Similar to exgA Probable glucan 1,3-beta-glucosidase A (Neosartorya fumigata (strain ATCC MYA-4609 / Af293 / CBS 101355 / FGSC A1100))" AED:0.08 eAED:0.08 QI:23/1/1/1/1/1/4/159/428
MSKLCVLVLAVAMIANYSSALNCGDGKIRGVNLGGWLVLEPWITPTIFEEVNVELGGQVVDEYTYAQYVDPDFASDRLNRHWDEFYTRADLVKLVDAGISHLRIPVGYWLVDVSPDEFFPPPPATDDDGQRFYLKRLAGWCEELGLKILIDLHCGPGSQNGFDNSGQRGEINWFNPDDHSNIDRTLVILEKISVMMKSWIDDGTMSPDTLFGIAILNEPWGIWEELWLELRDHFHYNAYDVVRNVLGDGPKVVIQQAFRTPTDFHGYMAEGFENVMLDLHEYHAFGEYWNNLAEDNAGWSTNIDTSCGFKTVMTESTMDVVVGEWSLANQDCQKYLDGGYDTPYHPPNGSPDTCAYYIKDFSEYTDDHKGFLRNFMAAQMDSYEAGDGYFFWTAKSEDNCAPAWDFLFLLEQGIAPQNLCERPRICTN